MHLNRDITSLPASYLSQENDKLYTIDFGYSVAFTSAYIGYNLRSPSVVAGFDGSARRAQYLEQLSDRRHV